MNDKTKYFLENKRESNLRKISKRFKCRFCFLSERLLKLIREKFCLTKQEVEQINEEINEINVSAKKYEKVEEHIEDFFALAQKLKVENAELKKDNSFIFVKLEELYMAEINDNKLQRKLIYKELGFDVFNFELKK